jgi:Meckel syndrome type 1 protein
MRQSAIAIAVLSLGLSPLIARAQAMPDRYGPTDPMTVGGRGGRVAQVSLLSWTGKVDALRGPQSASDSLRGPEPLDTSTGQAVRSANGARIQPASVAPQAAAPQPLPSAPLARLPTSLYDNGGGAPGAPQARPTQPVQSQALAPAGPPQAQSAQAEPQAASSDAQTPRYYSLHREYGLTPDPIPQAQASVLALGPAVAAAMATPPDNSPTIDLAGEDQAAATPPPRLRNPTTGATSSSSSTTSGGTTTSTYTFNNP